MADRIRAIATYTPKIKLEKTEDMDRLVEVIAGRSGLNRGTILNVIMELRDSMLTFAMDGRGVKVEGLGIFSPSINLAGEMRFVHRWDKWVKNKLNQKDFQSTWKLLRFCQKNDYKNLLKLFYVARCLLHSIVKSIELQRKRLHG